MNMLDEKVKLIHINIIVLKQFMGITINLSRLCSYQSSYQNHI